MTEPRAHVVFLFKGGVGLFFFLLLQAQIVQTCHAIAMRVRVLERQQHTQLVGGLAWCGRELLSFGCGTAVRGVANEPGLLRHFALLRITVTLLPGTINKRANGQAMAISLSAWLTFRLCAS